MAMESNLEPPAVVQQGQDQHALRQLERELQIEVGFRQLRRFPTFTLDLDNYFRDEDPVLAKKPDPGL